MNTCDTTIAWLLVAAAGLALSSWATSDAIKDKQAAELVGGPRTFARYSVNAESLRVLQQLLFLLIGIYVFLTVPPRGGACPAFNPTAWGLILGHVLIAVSSGYSVWFRRYELSSNEQDEDREGRRDAADEAREVRRDLSDAIREEAHAERMRRHDST